jgi:hypothetical protein
MGASSETNRSGENQRDQALGDDELRALKPGDLVRHISEAMPHTYVVTGNYGGRVTAVCSVDLTNASEWRWQARGESEVESLVRQIHQAVKRGERTQDHGLIGNLTCILGHVLPSPPAL